MICQLLFTTFVYHLPYQAPGKLTFISKATAADIFMKNFSELFEADTFSVLQTLSYGNGQAGFRIPEYQRPYSWETSQINRVLEDIASGIQACDQTNAPLTFLGSIILSEEKKAKGSELNGPSLAVVDGQQRLTTICLILGQLLEQVAIYLAHLSESQDDISTWLKDELDHLQDRLIFCILIRPFQFARWDDFHAFFPRLVRDGDERSKEPSKARYESLISHYLFKRGKNLVIEGSNDSVLSDAADVKESSAFQDRLKLISEQIINFRDGEGVGGMGVFEEAKILVEGNGYRKALFPKIDGKEHAVITEIKKGASEEIQAAIRLSALGNFCLDHVGVTVVISQEEQYAFDMFEALNTTGEPLTAIETFKPLVVQFEGQSKAGYSKSPSKKVFDNIESHFSSLGAVEKAREAQTSVVQLALLVDGEKVGRNLSEQRSYLRNRFSTSIKSDQGKRNFVAGFQHIVDYRREFWESERIPNCLPELTKDVGEVRFCLKFIKDLRTSLTVPILTRYMMQMRKSGNAEEFADAVRALTAFIVLRRAITKGTHGIDDDFRSLMAQGSKTRDNRPSLCIGTEASPNEIPSIQDLRSYLISYLKQGSITKILGEPFSKESWLKTFAQQPIYELSGGTTLTKFLLLSASHNSETGEEGLLIKGRGGPNQAYLSYETWVSEDHKTIEHIAPRGSRKGWNSNIFDDNDLKHTIGNLSLLPQEPNSAIGDAAWNKKRALYVAMAAPTQKELDKAIEQAEQGGIDFGVKWKTRLQRMSALPVLKSVGATPEWNKSVITQRSRNIGERVWDNIAPWLDYED